MDQYVSSKFFIHIPEAFQNFFDADIYVWDALKNFKNKFTVSEAGGQYDTKYPGAYIDDNVFIGAGTTIEPGAVIKGPTIIGNNCQVRSHAYIRGYVATGDNCVIGHSTEVIRSILFDQVRIDHFNYVGDSILGNKVHFGAGAKVANLRFDEKNIIIDNIDTGMNKLGLIASDNCQLGVNISVGPGVLLAPGTWVPSGDQLVSGYYDKTYFRK